MKNQQSGFTLIELIMVIVILGILAAVALPKFADFSGEARFASLNGALGAVRSASAIVHSAALVAGKTAEDDGLGNDTLQQVTLEGVAIDVKYGYATAASIMDAAQLSSEFKRATGTVTLGDCSFTYVEANKGEGEDAVITGPVIDGFDATSC